MTKEIIITINTNSIKKDFIPRYYYFVKDLGKIIDQDDNKIPKEYTTITNSLYKKFDILPNDLIFPYTIGLFQSNKLIGYYGYSTVNNIPNKEEFFTKCNSYITYLHRPLTERQRKRPIVYKVFNLITRKPLLVEEPIEIIEYGTSGLEDAILERVKSFYNFPDNKSTNITVEDNKIIITNESSS